MEMLRRLTRTPRSLGATRSKLSVAARHSDIAPEHGCNGELSQQNEEPAYVYVAWCSGCGTEFRYEPDSDWVTVVLPGMRRSLKI
jgi:hypothetical protein